MTIQNYLTDHMINIEIQHLSTLGMKLSKLWHQQNGYPPFKIKYGYYMINDYPKTFLENSETMEIILNHISKLDY